VGKHGSAVANVHVPQRRHAVDVIASVDISEGCASTAGEDQLRNAARGRIQVALRMEPVGPIQLVQPARFATFYPVGFHQPRIVARFAGTRRQPHPEPLLSDRACTENVHVTKGRKTRRQGLPKYGPADSKISPRFSGVRTYARLPHVIDLQDVDVAVVGIPFDTGGTYRVGARFGPEHIRSASALMRPYHSGSNVAVFEHLSVVDYGDLPVVPGYADESQRRITAGLLEVLRAGVIPI